MIENKKVMKISGIKVAMTILPYFLESMEKWGGPKHVEMFTNRLPLPLRVMLKYWWKVIISFDLSGIIYSLLTTLATVLT